MYLRLVNTAQSFPKYLRLTFTTDFCFQLFALAVASAESQFFVNKPVAVVRPITYAGANPIPAQPISPRIGYDDLFTYPLHYSASVQPIMYPFAYGVNTAPWADTKYYAKNGVAEHSVYKRSPYDWFQYSDPRDPVVQRPSSGQHLCWCSPHCRC